MIISQRSQGRGDPHVYTEGLSKAQGLSPVWGKRLWRTGLNFPPKGAISHPYTVITTGEVGVWVKISFGHSSFGVTLIV